jgi:hypothetical protein
MAIGSTQPKWRSASWHSQRLSWFQLAGGRIVRSPTLVFDDGKTVGAVARDMDLTETAVREWIKRARADRTHGRKSTRSPRDEIQEFSWRDDSHGAVLTNVEKIRIAGYDERRTTRDGAGDVLVIVGVRRQSWNVDVFADDLRQHDEIFKPKRRIDRRTRRLLYLGVPEGFEHFLDNRFGQHKVERAIAQERLDDMTRRAFRADERAHEDVRVQNDAQH